MNKQQQTEIFKMAVTILDEAVQEYERCRNDKNISNEFKNVKREEFERQVPGINSMLRMVYGENRAFVSMNADTYIEYRNNGEYDRYMK